MSPAVERIDFHNPSLGKPANLQNSAVLRMLEEEENRRGGRAGNDDYYSRPLRDVSWPPPEYDQKTHQRSSFKDVVTPGSKRVAWPPPQEGVLDPAEVVQHNAVQSQGGPIAYSNQSPGLQQNNYSPQQQQQQAVPYQQPAQQSYRPLKPLDVTSVGTGSPLTSPALNQSPQAYRPVTPAGSRGWAPVQSPATTPLGPGNQKYFGAPAQGYQSQPQYQPVAQPYQEVNQGYQATGQYQQQYQQTYQTQSQQQHSQGLYQQTPPQGQYQPQSSQGFYQQQQPAQGLYQQPSQGQFQQQPSQGLYQQPAQQFNQPSGFSSQPSQYQPQQYQSQPSPIQNQVPSQPSAVAQTQVAAPRQQPSGKQVEPPPSTITLRPAAPVSQAPPPVYSAQPATASLKGGKHLRGDLKWPPENVRDRMQEEHRHLIELAKGPACRPKRKDKDYTPFFEQHALNSTYPGYKIPPGTQFYRPE